MASPRLDQTQDAEEKKGIAEPEILEKWVNLIRELNEGHTREATHIYDSLKAHEKFALLNSTLLKGPYKGVPILYGVAKAIAGQELLCEHPELRDEITAAGLNFVIANGDSKGESALFWLTVSTKTRAFFLVDLKLRAKITEAGLNSVVQKGYYEGCSPLLLLAEDSKERLIFSSDADLCAKITSKGLNFIVSSGNNKGLSVIHSLAGNVEGQILLHNDASLRAKITKEGFNAIIQIGKDKGKSAASTLLSIEAGVELFRQHPELLKKITLEGLKAIVYSGGESMTMADWFLNTKDGQSFLNMFNVEFLSETRKELQAIPILPVIKEEIEKISIIVGFYRPAHIPKEAALQLKEIILAETGGQTHADAYEKVRDIGRNAAAKKRTFSPPEIRDYFNAYLTDEKFHKKFKKTG
jgi:hypothetical protein